MSAKDKRKILCGEVAVYYEKLNLLKWSNRQR